MPTHSVIETVSQVLAAADTLSIQFDPPADEAREGRFVPLAASSLHSELSEVVGQVAPQGMFTHHHSAIESVLAGRHTIAGTRTSSGKSLIFALPSLDAMCRDDSAASLIHSSTCATCSKPTISINWCSSQSATTADGFSPDGE